ncbi:MAG TPA: hypothetical protein VHF58_01415 [Solirubrobacterales bacterium]|nr:hypothetical protein [Solirubrobacterales bacterium]
MKGADKAVVSAQPALPAGLLDEDPFHLAAAGAHSIHPTLPAAHPAAVLDDEYTGANRPRASVEEVGHLGNRSPALDKGLELLARDASAHGVAPVHRSILSG